MVNRLFDLRFVIGLFFLVIGILLIVHGFVGGAGLVINKWAGGLFLVFGIFMIVLSGKKPSAD